MHFKKCIRNRRQFVGYGTGTDCFEGSLDRLIRFGTQLTRLTGAARLEFAFGFSFRINDGRRSFSRGGLNHCFRNR